MNDNGGDATAAAWPHAVAAAVTGSVLSAVPLFLVAALAPQIRDSLQFGITGFGALLALYYLCAAIGSLPLSRVVESIGAMRAMRTGSALVAILLFMFALLARGVVSLACLIALAGFVSSGIQPATNLFLIQRIPVGHRGLAFGFKQAAVPLAVTLSGLSVPVLALTLGWRWTFAIVAALALGASTAMPRTRRPITVHRRQTAVPPLERPDVVYLVALTVGFCLGIASASALTGFVVTALAAADESYTVAGITASLGGLVAASVRMLAGLQFDRRPHSPLAIVVVMLALGAAAYALLAIATAFFKLLLVPAFLLAFALGWGWSGLFNLAIATRYPEQAARATAITSVGGRSGGVLGPFLFGLLVDHGSYAWAWLLTAIAAALGALIILLARRADTG